MSFARVPHHRRIFVVLGAGAIVAVSLALIAIAMRSRAAREAELSGLSSAPVGTRGDIERVLVISVDGLRPDLLLRADCPNIRSLMARGSYSMWARTTEMSITLPSHTSMLTGVRPDIHRITWNDHTADKATAYTEVPTLFEQAHRAKPGLTTGMVAGKSKFRQLGKPGSMEWMEVYDDGYGSNVAVGQSAADMIRRHAPRVMFVHFPDVDGTGHRLGWGTPQQIEAVQRADEGVGLILDAMERVKTTDHTLVILSADHGGQGLGHGPNDPRSRHIPWIAAGPGVRRNYDLTRLGPLVINTEDTFVTACTVMNIPLPAYTDGKFVEQIFLSDELLKPSTVTVKDDGYGQESWATPAYKYEPTPIPSPHN